MNTESISVANLLRSSTLGGPIALVFSDASYLPVLNNWIVHARRVRFDNIVVGALDEVTASAMQTAGVPNVMIEYDGTLADLWVARARLFASLCCEGIDFLHSDADAVWRKNPTAYVSSMGTDLVFSQGTIWPPDIVERWSFVLCAGFFYVKASYATSMFFQTVATRAAIELDDQSAINRTLYEAGILWADRGGGIERFWNGRAFKVFSHPIVGRTDAYSVALLPHYRFPRLPEVDDETIVAHPLSDKSCEQKILALEALGLWDDSSRAVVPHSGA